MEKKFNTVDIDKDGFIVFESDYNSFTTVYSDGFKTNNFWFGTRISASEEENFSARFNKAMNYLLTYVKKTKSAEIF